MDGWEVSQHTFPPFDLCCWPKCRVLLVETDGGGGGLMKKGISGVILFAYKNAHGPSFLNTEGITQVRASFHTYSSRPAPGSSVTPNPSVFLYSLQVLYQGLLRLFEVSVPCLFQCAVFLSPPPPELYCSATHNLLSF